MTMRMFYVWGTTCSGKDTLLNRAAELYPDVFGLVQVGAELRRRYPPERFRGLGAMPDTEREVYAIFDEQYAAAVAGGKRAVLVSGQPRLIPQVNRILLRHPGLVLWLHAPEEELKRRIDQRFPCETVRPARELALQRLASDRVTLFDVMFAMTERRVPIEPFDTSRIKPDEIIEWLMWRL